ncbi:MAG: hypothetical protein RIS25_21 [Actinomycetota bacterium]
MSRITMEDVAREAGVSRALVSIAYRDAVGVSDATKAHIIDVGTRLGYVPNRIAARLASKNVDTVGVFLQDLHNEVFADVFDGIRDIIDDSDAQLVLAVGRIDGSGDAAAIRALFESRVDVIIAAGLMMTDSEVRAVAQGTPLISVTRDVPGIDSVCADDVAGGTIATAHLIESGHTNIVFLSNPQTQGYQGRQRGYLEAITAAGLEPRIVPVTYDRHDAEVAAGLIVDSPHPPTAFFAHNDQTALGVLDAIVLRGLRPGKDIAVVGYDNTSLSQAPVIALTTVDPHSIELGRSAARQALTRMADAAGDAAAEARVSIVHEPTLVARASTAR